MTNSTPSVIKSHDCTYRPLRPASVPTVYRPESFVAAPVLPVVPVVPLDIPELVDDPFMPEPIAEPLEPEPDDLLLDFFDLDFDMVPALFVSRLVDCMSILFMLDAGVAAFALPALAPVVVLPSAPRLPAVD